MKVCQKCHTEVEDHTRFCPNCGTQVIDESGEDHGLIGRTLAGKFLLKEEIGAGAMGKIYRAEQINLGRAACIKVLHPHLMGDPTLSKRFHREARAASRLKHPNCINVLDFGIAESDNIHYIAMDFLDGRDLAHLIRDEFPIDPMRFIHLGEQICAALDEAHAAGIIHRDLKPENVFVEDRRLANDFVTVLDFGIAKIKDRDGSDPETFATMAGVVCGTPEYMSPEQARGDPLDARSDLYAMGVMFFHMITGQLPFTGDTPIGIVTKHLTEAPPDIRELNPNCHPDLVDLTNRLLSKDKDIRPPSAMSVKRELERFKRTLESDTDALSMTAPMARPEALAQPARPSTPVPPALDPDATEPAADPPWATPSDGAETDDFPLVVQGSSAGRWVLVFLVLAVLGGGGWYLYTEVLSTGPVDPTSDSEGIAATDDADAVSEVDTVAVKPPVGAEVTAPPPEDVLSAPDAAPVADAATVDTGAPETVDVAETPEIPAAVDLIDPEEEARDFAAERIAALSSVLQIDKNMLVARQSTLIKHEATWMAKETAEAIQRIADLEANIGAAKSDLAADKVAEATGALETIKKDVKETHTAATVILDRPIPSKEEVAAHKEAEERVRSLRLELGEADKSLETMRSALNGKRDAWIDAERKTQASAVAGELETLASLQTRHGALLEGLTPENAAEQASAAAGLAEERAAFQRRVDKLLEAKVRSRAQEEEERKRKEAEERKRKEAEERKRKEDEAAAEAAAKADAKAKAEEEFQTLVKDADSARSQGSYATAIGLYKQALKRKDSTSIREHLGKAYNATGQNSKAAEQLRICVTRLEARLEKTTSDAEKSKLQGKIDLIKRQIRD